MEESDDHSRMESGVGVSSGVDSVHDKDGSGSSIDASSLTWNRYLRSCPLLGGGHGYRQSLRNQIKEVSIDQVPMTQVTRHTMVGSDNDTNDNDNNKRNNNVNSDESEDEEKRSVL